MAAQLTHQEFYIPGTQLHSTPNHKAIIECNICSAIKMQLPTLASANKMFCFGQWLFITVDWVERLLENGSIFLFYILALKAIPYFLLCWLGRSWKQQWKYDCETEHIVRYFLSCLLTDCCFQSCIFIVLNVTYTNTLPACSPSLPGITHKQWFETVFIIKLSLKQKSGRLKSFLLVRHNAPLYLCNSFCHNKMVPNLPGAEPSQPQLMSVGTKGVQWLIPCELRPRQEFIRTLTSNDLACVCAAMPAIAENARCAQWRVNTLPVRDCNPQGKGILMLSQLLQSQH